MKHFSLHYTLRTSRFDQIWFPLAFWAVFIFITIIRGDAYVQDTAKAYLGAVVPLISGIMACYAVLENPALELRFATPVPAIQTLLEHLALTFLIQTFFAMAYQGFALLVKPDFAAGIGFWDIQLAWLIPTLSLSTFGCFAALVAAQATTGAVLAGMIWIVELVGRGWFAAHPIGQYLLIFESPFMLDHPALRANQVTLAVLSFLLLFSSWLLLHRQERYL